MPAPTAAVSSLSRQLAAPMRLSSLALRESDLEFFLQEACRSAAEGVGAGFAGVLQYRADEQIFVLQAGVGMQARFVGRTRIAADLGTTAGLAWHAGEPVHFGRFAAGGRLRMLDTAIGHGVRWLVSIPVPGEGEERFGVLEVGSAGAGEFAQGDLAFLQGLADCIGAAVQRHADRACRADRATLVAERRRVVRKPQPDTLGRPEASTRPDRQRRSQGGCDRTEFPTAQNAAMRRQPSTACSKTPRCRMEAGSPWLVVPRPLRPAQLDCFLHGLFGTECNGMNKRVVSALARLWHDPWVEAASRAGLPRAVAADDLASTLASVPAGLPATRAVPGLLASVGHPYAGSVNAQSKGRIGHARRGKQV